MPEPTPSQLKVLRALKKLDPNLQIRWNEKTGLPARIRGTLSKPLTGPPDDIAKQFLASSKALFIMTSPKEDMKLREVVVDARGNKHVRLAQTYRGLPVFSRELIVHLTPQNTVRGVNGEYETGIDLPDKPEITGDEAVNLILKDDPQNRPIQGKEPVLLVLIHDEKKYLAWNLLVEGVDRGLDGKELEAIWVYFVDALTGQVIWRYNNFQTHTRTTGTGTGLYSGAVSLNTYHNHIASEYELIDAWLPGGGRITTYDCAGGGTGEGLSCDADNDWAAADQGPEVDCHVYTRIIYDYFLTTFGRDSFDGLGGEMVIWAHYRENYNNAGWDGTRVKIGDGDGIDFTSFCALDVIAHEWTHAVNSYTANLPNHDEPGALNESIADVFACLIDGNWLYGEDNWCNMAWAPACRNLADPTNGGRYSTADPLGCAYRGYQPDHYDDRYTDIYDAGGVHINNGIMNKAAYLIAVGGTHRGIQICEALGRDVLGYLYYQALTCYLVPGSDFADMRRALLDSLEDLYDGDPHYSRWRVSINNACAAVGIGTEETCPMVCFISPVPVTTCAPGALDYGPSSTPCPHGPLVTCPPGQIFSSYTCPPSPVAHGCVHGPEIGCLPGPDPLPFNPEIVSRPPLEHSAAPDIPKRPRAARTKNKA